MTTAPTQPKQTELAHFWALAKAVLWSALAASITIGVFVDTAPSRVGVGFIGGIVFSAVFAHFNRKNKEQSGRSFIGLPPLPWRRQ
jgi:hypothetical protein